MFFFRFSTVEDVEKFYDSYCVDTPALSPVALLEYWFPVKKKENRRKGDVCLKGNWYASQDDIDEIIY